MRRNLLRRISQSSEKTCDSVWIVEVMFYTLIVLFHIYSTIHAETDSQLEPRGNFHSELKHACSIYEEALPNLFHDFYRLFKDTFYFVFVKWPELLPPFGSERIVDKDTLAQRSLVLEKSLLRVQALVIKDIGSVLDEIAEGINLASILKKIKATGFKLHVI